MEPSLDAQSIAAGLHLAIGQFTRRVRDSWSSELSLPERTLLARLDRHGPDTTAALARWEQITPQSVGKTVNGLHERGFIDRAQDPEDGRRSILTINDAGREVLNTGRGSLKERITDALEREFDPEEIELLAAAAPLIDRLSRLI